MIIRQLLAISAALVLVTTIGCSSSEPTVEVTDVVTKPSKPSKVYPSIPPTTRITDLHYPNYKTLEEAVEDAESRLAIRHYRKALQEVHPTEHYPDRAGAARAYARPSSKDGDLDRGVVVDVDLWSVEAIEGLDAT
ncbi:MAG: hypothetical protein ACI9G1_005697 [Pirellulaceae bacterium]|jgi:hypothetical protein